MNFIKSISIKTIGIGLFFLSNFNVSAQISYKTENFTHELSPFKISLALLSFENILTPITAGIMVEGHLKDKLFYNAQFRQGYMRNFMISKENLETTQKESKGTYFEAGMDWSFKEKMKTGKMKITTSSSSDGYTKSETYFMAECDVRKYWALSGGVLAYIRPKYTNSDSSYYIISDDLEIKPANGNFTHFNQSTFGAFGGVSHRKIKKAIVATDGTNYRNFRSTKFYAHALIGATSAGDIEYNGQNYKITNAKQMPIGYRIGWQWDQMGVVTGFEFGKMPGVGLETSTEKSEISKIFVQNPYLNYIRFTFQFNIFNGDRNYHIKK